MSGNEGITLQSVREFLIKNDGKVKNIDLVHHFRQQLNDPANKSEYKFAELKMDYFYKRWLCFLLIKYDFLQAKYEVNSKKLCTQLLLSKQ